MSQNRKLLSICIPTWNRESLLNEQVELLSNQIVDYKLNEKIELVISNNGSDDFSETIVRKYQTKFNFITYHNNITNKGARFNLLKSFELASGEFLLFLGDDDRYKNNGLNILIEQLELNKDVNAFFNFGDAVTENIKDFLLIELSDLLKKYYYLIGNAGLFIIKTDLIKLNINKYGYDYFSLSWPQTQLIILSLSSLNNKRLLLTNINLFDESKHDQLMMYNSYYLLRGLYFDLVDAIDSIKSEISQTHYDAARLYLKNHIIQNTFNILQCGVYVDNIVQRNKTITYIKEQKFKFSSYERVFLNLIIIILSLPIWLSKSISNFFIFTTRGKKGLEKKNNFVSRELRKIQISKNHDKSVRTFDFTP